MAVDGALDAAMIAHFDVDAFYASVAVLDGPALRGLPLAVSGDSRRSVVLTASYEARAFGVRSAMPLFKAKALCRDLVVVPPNFTRYRELSRAIFAILERDADAVEGLSLDEAFVALRAATFDDAIAAAARIRACVRDEVGLTVSAGVSQVKMVAKIASDAAKPDGLRAVEPGTERAYLAPLPAGRLWGIGPKTQERLRNEGLETIGQLAELSDEDAFRLFGRGGRGVRDLARGIDERRVVSDRETRSVSSEETYEYDIRDEEILRARIRELALDVAERLRRAELRGTTIGIKLKRADFSIVVRQTALAEPSDDAAVIEAAALKCLERAELDGVAVRLLGVRVASLTTEATQQLSFFVT